MEHLWNAVVSGTKHYLDENGFTQVLLGLSGGVDSSMTACIAVAAVGPENVLGVMMPSPYSSEGSVMDSVKLAEGLGIETKTIPIEPMMTAFENALEKAFENRARDATEENIQARIRGVLLMALSNKYGSLLLNTCNKSEDYVGYCTLYGDSCGGIAPIGDVYKTDLYKLARWMNDRADLPSIPEVIIEKPPSAELSPGQLDTDDLPPYDVLDAVLKLYVDRKMGAADIVKQGHDRPMVERIIQLVEGSAFKRLQCPPAVKV